VSELLHCHVYTEGVGKKGANNVASLIIKMLQKLNLLCKNSVGGKLNIMFNNCSIQNKKQHSIEATGMADGNGVFQRETLYINCGWPHKKCT
jgi:hypothetical protein